MADIRQLTPTFAVAPQLAAEDFADLAAQGFKTVIGNRPDGESPGEMQSAAAIAAAKAAGLAYIYAPFAGRPTQDSVDAVINAGQGPVLAYCRSGTRSTTAWAIAQAASGQMNAADIIAAAAEGGYNLRHLEDYLQSLQPR